jgi:hypothetical protein
MSEEEIKILMAREIVEDVCSAVGEASRPKCRMVLHKILVHGATPDNLKELMDLPDDCRAAIREKLRELGVE